MDNALEQINARGAPFLPGHLGMVVTAIASGSVAAELTVTQTHLAPNGYLHAGTIVTLADSACGYGCMASLPEGAANFTTIELKSNFMSTTREGTIRCEAKLLHGGRTTQVWDANVINGDNGKLMATFRCTQMILWPR